MFTTALQPDAYAPTPSLRVPTSHPPTPHHSLTRLWAARYMPKLSLLQGANPEFPIAQLLEHTSAIGRRRTVDLVQRHLRINCELAGLESNRLFAGESNVINLAKVRRIATYVEQVYERLLAVYLEHPYTPPVVGLPRQEPINVWQLSGSTMPPMPVLLDAVEPVLRDLREQHFIDEDPRVIGFVTTQFHFTAKALFGRLGAWDQVLLSPYFQFAEEQVCIPWQQICYIADRHAADAPELRLVEKMLGNSDGIAFTVYETARQRLGGERTLRGDLTHPGVIASTIRDLNMFQAYLLLAILEGKLTAIEEHLLPLCLMVFPMVKVSWEFVDQALQLLVAEIKSRLSPAEWERVCPLTAGLLDMFATSDSAMDGAMVLGRAGGAPEMTAAIATHPDVADRDRQTSALFPVPLPLAKASPAGAVQTSPNQPWSIFG